ncbi:MAG: hypothetical protein HFI75_01520 [Lachnospiraceae bacterium]|nr:hypothetical protein [Lachnospiraceae bacterium]
MKAVLDHNGYFTGDYAMIGSLEGSIEVESIPTETDRLKLKSYKFENGVWTFDSEHHQSLYKEQQAKELASLKQQKAEKSKKNLEQYIQTHKITSSCHGGIEKQYSATSENQQHLNNMILTTLMAATNELSYQPSWNASGEECTNDWTLEELVQLSMEIEAFIRPLVVKQQAQETAIQNACSIEELEQISITFEQEG